MKASDVESVEAAWGFVKRGSAKVGWSFHIVAMPMHCFDFCIRGSSVSGNYFDQSFNNQDWEAAHQQYLDRAKKGQRSSLSTAVHGSRFGSGCRDSLTHPIPRCPARRL